MMHNSMSKLEDAGSPIHRVISAAASEQNQNISFTTKVSLRKLKFFLQLWNKSGGG